MSVRGTTYSLDRKKVTLLEGDRGGKVLCSWDECDRDGYMLYSVRINNAKPGFTPQYNWHIFCTERHKQYWLSSSRNLYGKLPSGMRNVI